MQLTGLSAFPLTPLHEDEIDEKSFIGLIHRLHAAGVDSITALGSTGSYPYFDRAERARVAKLAVQSAASTPVLIGIGALRTSQVLAYAEDAESAGASGVLLAPMSYQPLTEDDVFTLFKTVTEHTSLPVVVYDNPGTTHFHFSLELYGRITALPGIVSIKIPGVPEGLEAAREHIDSIRSVVPEHVTIGVSGDATAARGLLAGCDIWYSVIGGTLPELAMNITRLALNGETQRAMDASARLASLWQLFSESGGSYRVIAAVAEQLGLVNANSLPLPIQGLDAQAREKVARVLDRLELK